MIGYKGIEVEKGILRSKANGGDPGEIFEIGVPSRKVELDDGYAFSENGFSFCGAMEYVLPWENILGPKDVSEVKVSRLFRIDTLDGKVIGGISHYKAEKIVVLEEVTKDEIVAYFTEHTDRLKEKYRNDFEDFCNRHWEPYRELLDKKQINDLIVNSCFRRQQKTMCKQVDGQEDIKKCESCMGYTFSGDVGDSLVEYWYLEAKRKLKEGDALANIEEYRLLSQEKRTAEVRGLKLLYEERYM